MKKRLVLTACVCAVLLAGCTVNVNELAKNNSSDSQTDIQSDISTDTETRSNPFIISDTDTHSDEESDIAATETEIDTSSPVFDESQYTSKYVSGSAEIVLTADALYGSKEVGRIACGEKVSVVHSDVKEYSFVYSAALGNFGYVQTIYLADSPEETTVGEIYYIKPVDTIIYSDADETVFAARAVQNEAVTVIVKSSDGNYLVVNASGVTGYIDKSYLSETKVKTVSSKSENSKKTKSEKKAESKADSKAESKASSKLESTVESKIESKTESKTESKLASSEEETVSALYSGKGNAPENYEVYICDVDEGYLALRDAPSRTKSKVIGEVYYEEQIYVIDTSGEYWYVYIPSSGMYGYVTGNTDYLYPQEWYE